MHIAGTTIIRLLFNINHALWTPCVICKDKILKLKLPEVKPTILHKTQVFMKFFESKKMNFHPENLLWFYIMKEM